MGREHSKAKGTLLKKETEYIENWNEYTGSIGVQPLNLSGKKGIERFDRNFNSTRVHWTPTIRRGQQRKWFRKRIKKKLWKKRKTLRPGVEKL